MAHNVPSFVLGGSLQPILSGSLPGCTEKPRLTDPGGVHQPWGGVQLVHFMQVDFLLVPPLGGGSAGNLAIGNVLASGFSFMAQSAKNVDPWDPFFSPKVPLWLKISTSWKNNYLARTQPGATCPPGGAAGSLQRISFYSNSGLQNMVLLLFCKKKAPDKTSKTGKRSKNTCPHP